MRVNGKPNGRQKGCQREYSDHEKVLGKRREAADGLIPRNLLKLISEHCVFSGLTKSVTSEKTLAPPPTPTFFSAS